mmetsp:Transcript_37602/g.70227  ORF Transcript_37602/g.70227 Transcript_37602/m.70227 type:complete len:182 (-) Transcript_37602:44-589(-)
MRAALLVMFVGVSLPQWADATAELKFYSDPNCAGNETKKFIADEATVDFESCACVDGTTEQGDASVATQIKIYCSANNGLLMNSFPITGCKGDPAGTGHMQVPAEVTQFRAGQCAKLVDSAAVGGIWSYALFTNISLVTLPICNNGVTCSDSALINGSCRLDLTTWILCVMILMVALGDFL